MLSGHAPPPAYMCSSAPSSRSRLPRPRRSPSTCPAWVCRGSGRPSSTGSAIPSRLSLRPSTVRWLVTALGAPPLGPQPPPPWSPEVACPQRSLAVVVRVSDVLEMFSVHDLDADDRRSKRRSLERSAARAPHASGGGGGLVRLARQHVQCAGAAHSFSDFPHSTRGTTRVFFVDRIRFVLLQRIW